MNRNYRRSQQGFTLVETATVLFLIGLLSAISIPSFMGIVDAVKVQVDIFQIAGYMRGGQPQKVDEKYRQLMIFKGDKDGDYFLSNKELQEFPCSILKRTEDVFSAYRTEDGNSKHGLGAQARIWFEMRSRPEGATYNQWMEALGWLGGITTDDVSFLPDGHLPHWSGIKAPADTSWHPDWRLRTCGLYPESK